MGCVTTTVLDHIVLDCDDVPTGGIKAVYIANACDAAIGFQEDDSHADFGKVKLLGFDTGKVYKMEFNRKDGVTAWEETKTVEDSGIVTNVPTFTIEFPKMTLEKRNFVNDILNPNSLSILFIEDAAGTKHALGAKFGMRATEGVGASGTGRTEKNAFTLTFTGEETEFSYDMEEKWANVENKEPIASGGEGDWTVNPDALTIPRQSCLATPA